MRLGGGTVLVTGGNSGIGLATARAFIRAVARVDAPSGAWIYRG
jgi:NAD(P)-dependent dehydrogenase (short-subunit alcohol dehydrogenase family)